MACDATEEDKGEKVGERISESEDNNGTFVHEASVRGVSAQEAEVELRLKQAVADIDIQMEESQAALAYVITEKLATAEDRAMCAQMDSGGSGFEFLDEKTSAVESRLSNLEDDFRSEFRHLQKHMDLKLGEELNERLLGTLQAAISPMAEILTKKILECEHKILECSESCFAGLRSLG